MVYSEWMTCITHARFEVWCPNKLISLHFVTLWFGFGLADGDGRSDRWRSQKYEWHCTKLLFRFPIPRHHQIWHSMESESWKPMCAHMTFAHSPNHRGWVMWEGWKWVWNLARVRFSDSKIDFSRLDFPTTFFPLPNYFPSPPLMTVYGMQRGEGIIAGCQAKKLWKETKS